MRRLPEDGAEAADEVRLGDMGHRGHGADVERLGVGAVHGVAGAQQAPVQILDFPAHGATLRHPGGVCSARTIGSRAKPSITFGANGLASTLESRRLVGVVGFEPTTSCSQSTHAARLRHTPTQRW